LKPSRIPILEAVTALILVIAMLLSMGSPGGLPELIGQHVAALGHGSGEAPFLPQRLRPRTLSSQPGLRANSAAAKDTVILTFGSAVGAIDEFDATRYARHGETVQLLYLLRNTAPDRAPPYLT